MFLHDYKTEDGSSASYSIKAVMRERGGGRKSLWRKKRETDEASGSCSESGLDLCPAETWGQKDPPQAMKWHNWHAAWPISCGDPHVSSRIAAAEIRSPARWSIFKSSYMLQSLFFCVSLHVPIPLFCYSSLMFPFLPCFSASPSVSRFNVILLC